MTIKAAIAVSLAASLALASCTTSLEATLEITTTAVETLTQKAGVTLHPRGDTITIGPGAANAIVSMPGSGTIKAAAGSVVELSVIENDPAAGILSKVTVDGRQVFSAKGRLEVTVSWIEKSVRLLPPKVETVEIELEPGEGEDIDLTVMYAPMPDSKLEEVKTEVRLKGPDAEKLKWVESAPPALGRVKGRVEAPAKQK